MPTYYNRRPAFETSIRRYIQGELLDLHVSIPGRVEYYDPSRQWADVQPLLAQVYLDESDQEIIVPFPVIPNVPILFPRGNGFYIHWPLRQGDPVDMICSQRSLDAWKSSDGKTILDPLDARHHHLTDAYAIPGGSTAQNAINLPNNTDLIIGRADGSVEIHVTSDGKIKLGSGSLSEVTQGLVTKADLDAFVNNFYNTHTQIGNLGVATSPPLVTGATQASSQVFAVD